MSKPSWRSMPQVVVEDEYDEMNDLASTMASITTSVWESKIDANESTAFFVQPYV